METSIVVAIVVAAIPGVLSFIIAIASGIRQKNKAEAASLVVDSAMKIVNELQEKCVSLEAKIKELDEDNKQLKQENAENTD